MALDYDTGAMPRRPYPTRPEDVTPDWLTEVLRVAHPGLPTVASFATTRIGTGQVGQCIRYELRYAGEPAAGTPSSVVGKFASPDPTSREAGKVGRCYILEVGFYRDLQTTVGIRTPRCYFAAIDDTDIDHALVLEDMAPARQGDQIEGCSLDDAAAALVQLARLHAPRWNDPSLAELAWLDQPVTERAGEIAAMYAMLLPAFEERYEGRLDADTIALCRDLAPVLEALLSDASGPRTIVHRDYRIDNMLFGDGVTAPRVSVVDWQTVGLAVGATDAAYFLGAGLSTELRRAHERTLLREYHDALVAGGVDGYHWDDCWRDYRRSTTAGLLMAVVASMIVGATERGDEMFMTMASRHAAHAIDLDVREFF